MGWADARARLLNKAPAMSVDDVFTALQGRDAVLWVDGPELRYVGPDLSDSDPLYVAIDTHRAILTEWFTYAPGRRCRYEDCYRLRVAGDSTSCAEHRSLIETLAAMWDQS